jgi:moderate conductance mechanosensitive channel
MDISGSTVVEIAVTVVVAAAVQLLVRSTIGRIVHRAVHGTHVGKRYVGHRYTNKEDEEKRERTLVNIFRTATAVMIWTVAAVVILWQLQVNIAALLTGAGLIGIVVGLGAQSAIKDFVSGIFIIAENQYRVGDIITLNTGGQEVSGIVEDITIRITRLRDLDGNLHTVPNGNVWTVTNRTFHYANVNIDVRVAYESDLDKVEKIVNTVGTEMKEDEAWAERIVEPVQFLRVDGFEDWGVRIKALGKVEPAQQWDVAGEFRRRVIKAFEKNGVTIPLPQIVVHSSPRTK